MIFLWINIKPSISFHRKSCIKYNKSFQKFVGFELIYWTSLLNTYHELSASHHSGNSDKASDFEEFHIISLTKLQSFIIIKDKNNGLHKSMKPLFVHNLN